MPILPTYYKRLIAILEDVARHFGTPFHIYDEAGMRQTGEDLKRTFAGQGIDFREFYAVKALPNPRILSIMAEMGFGFDCSSPLELALCRGIGAVGDDLFFTSTNTTTAELEAALAAGALVNLDDLALLDKLPSIPQRLSFRYNPGPLRQVEGAHTFIGSPSESKFGVTAEQAVEGCRRALALGVQRFGIHTMHTANSLDYRVKLESAHLLLALVETITDKTAIKIDFINLGGGFGIPYRPEESPLDMAALAGGIADLFADFKSRQGYAPALYMESGRYVSGPHGCLATRVTNIKRTYRTFVGVDASMPALMRPGMYGSYHHISVFGKHDADAIEPVDVVGSLCENNDKFAVQRPLPPLSEGDLLLIHDTGAHGHAMGFTYNARLRPKELLLRADGRVELIRRAETAADYMATLDFAPDCFELF